MVDKLSFQNTFQMLEKAIGLAHQRHSLIASNLSNLDTPGHRAKDIDFKSAMDRALSEGSPTRLVRTNPNHIGKANGISDDVESFEEKGECNGINWVNLYETIVKQMENTLVYRAATEALLRKIALMKEVLRESGR